MTPEDTKSRREADERERLRVLLHDLKVDTGDVVLFDRQCGAMSAYGAAICVCAKYLGQTSWDHNGVVIKDPETHELLLLEATLTGVKMRSLIERLMRSKSNEIAVRRLQVHRTQEFSERAMAFVTLLLNCPYEDRVRLLFNAGFSSPSRLERERLFHLVVESKKELAKLDADLDHRQNMSDFERTALALERDKVYTKYQLLSKELNRTERSLFENESKNPLDTGKVFCSALVASLYQHLGLLLPYPASNSYLPKHFSSQNQYLKLQRGGSFLREVSLRHHLEENHRQYRNKVEESQFRSPTAQEISLLVRCLRRHPLFHTLSECELHEMASQFRRRVVEDGEVVFYQGMDGDFFYFIETGECDVYVDYEYLQQTANNMDESEASEQKETREPVRLKRRRTIALPEFQSSSSLIGKHERTLVATNGSGNAFGDSALMYNTPRRATLVARALNHDKKSQFSESKKDNEVVLWQLGKSQFKQTVAAHESSAGSLEERHFLLQAISAHPLFASLDERAKALAVRKCFPLQVAKGASIINQGDSGDYFYVIESGKCEITRKKPKTKAPLVDRVIGRGATFGEAALLYNSRRGASVRALEDTRVWCMDRASFLTITRSGSTALLRLFERFSSVAREKEVFLTSADLTRLLQGNNPTLSSQNRARELARALLFHDCTGLVNFSQFAHFHMALNANTITALLLPEAAFRVLHLETPLGASRQERGLLLSDLPRAIEQW